MRKLLIFILLISEIKAETNINNLILRENNSISSGSYIDNNVNVKQGVIEVKDSTIKNSEFDFTNKIIKTGLSENSEIRQSFINLDSSTISNSKFNLKNTISNSTIGRSIIDQSVILLNNSEIKDSNITTNNLINKLKTGGVNTITQASITLNSGSTISKSKLILTNTIDDTYLVDSSISQAEIIMNGATIQNAVIENTNKVFNDSEIINGSSLIQGKIALSSGVTLNHNITISSTADNVVLNNSTVSMCGVTMNSDSTADISKTCSNDRSEYRNVTISIAGS